MEAPLSASASCKVCRIQAITATLKLTKILLVLIQVFLHWNASILPIRSSFMPSILPVLLTPVILVMIILRKLVLKLLGYLPHFSKPHMLLLQWLLLHPWA